MCNVCMPLLPTLPYYLHSYIHTYMHYIHTYIHTVFVGGKSIGGGDDTKALSDAGKLKPLLKVGR